MLDWFDPAHWFDAMMNWASQSILTVFDAIFALIAQTMLISPDVTELPQVRALTAKSTVVVDTVFVLAFVAAGALTMVAGGSERSRYTVKDLVPRLVVGFIAAHFSQVLARQAIGVANGLTGALSSGDTDKVGALTAIRGQVDDAAGGSVTPMLFAVLVVIIAALVASTVLGMLTRFAVLLVLASVAPLALGCHALPQTESVARVWWRSFCGCLITPVLQAFTLQAGQWMLEDPAHVLPVLGLPNDPTGLLNLFIIIVLLLTTVKIPGLVRRYVTQGARGTNPLGAMVRVIIVQQLTRGFGRAAQAVAAVAR
ncbi:hypothetical protein [Rugosimonospora acidiphila]